MSEVATVAPPVQPPYPVNPVTGQTDPELVTLPDPLLEGEQPYDALSLIMLSMEQMSALSMEQTESQLRATREQLDEHLKKFLEELRKAVEALQEAKKKKDEGGGFLGLGKLFDDLIHKVVQVLASLADLTADLITQPVDLAVGVAKNLDDPQAILQIFGSELAELTKNGKTAQSVEQFLEGLIKFSLSVAQFALKLGMAQAQAALEGGSVWDSLKGEIEKLYQSLKENILDNEGFWEVVGTLAKAASLAATVVSGGLAAGLAIAIFAALEADNRYGWINETFGEDAGVWVRGALQIAYLACCLANSPLFRKSQDLSEVSAEIKRVTRGINGITQALNGARSLDQAFGTDAAAERRADQLRRNARLQELLNQLHQLERLLDSLLDDLKEENEDRNAKRELGNRAAQAQATAESAVVMRV